jgi:hypothetical protein
MPSTEGKAPSNRGALEMTHLGKLHSLLERLVATLVPELVAEAGADDVLGHADIPAIDPWRARAEAVGRRGMESGPQVDALIFETSYEPFVQRNFDTTSGKPAVLVSSSRVIDESEGARSDSINSGFDQRLRPTARPVNQDMAESKSETRSCSNGSAHQRTTIIDCGS